MKLGGVLGVISCCDGDWKTLLVKFSFGDLVGMIWVGWYSVFMLLETWHVILNVLKIFLKIFLIFLKN